MSDVINISDRKKKTEEKEKETTEEMTGMDFATIIKQNKEKKEKLEKERLSKNRSVLRSYRIKN